MRKYLLVLLWVCNNIESATSQTCLRASLIRDGTCTKQCDPSKGCAEPNSDCLCDGQCGFSCVQRGLSCGSPPQTRNADLASTGTRFNDTVVYKCQSGFTLNGDNTRRCTAKGTWSGIGPTCMPVCKEPELPFGAFVKSTLKSEYKTGEVIMLDCKKGFKKIGNPSRICISGRWTAFPFECRATHSCRRTIRASRTRCTGKCSPEDPDGCPANHKCLCDGQCGYSCVENGLQCPAPINLNNGFISFTNTGYNATATYKCRENYTLNGDRVRRCTAKKRWEGAVPSCLPDCSQPRIPPHAYIEHKKPKYASGDRVTFKCDAGYNQEGIPTTLCFMGNWNVMPFRCDKGGCGDPGTPENGNKVGISYAPGKEVFFSCNLGYIRVGSEQRRCLPNNTWSGTQPTCEIIDCGEVPELENGTIFGNETTFQKTVWFKCDEGFELEGNFNAICQSDIKWSDIPKCKPLDCGILDAPLHGSKIGDETTYTNKVEFSCDPGYRLIGSAVRHCPSTGEWDGEQPSCQALDCGVLKAPRNGSLQGDQWTYPNSVRFYCDAGFNLIGSSTRKCQTDGTWGGQPVRCEARDCGKLDVPLNGTLIGRQTTYPVTVEFRCDEGFTLKGSRYRKCQASGRWSGKLTSCSAVDCGKPVSPEYGTPTGVGTTFPNIIRYECEEGYLLNGSRTRQCQSDGKWSGRDPTCDAIDCGVLAAPINGSKIGHVYIYPSDVSFACDKGFDLIGSKSRVCLSNGSWSGQDTFCKAVDCGPLAVPKNGSSKGSLTTFPNLITFECDKGFKMTGPSSRECQANTKWSGDLTACEAVDCGPVKQPMNGSIFGSATVFPNKISFACDVGFLLKGSQQRKCQASGKWSGQTTRCEAVDCGSLAVPLNGSLQGQLTVFPNKIKFSCDVGFDLIGSSVRRCQSNGLWSGTVTKCKAKHCGLLTAPVNGSSTGDLFTYPNKIQFSCDRGFDLRGSQIRKCLANGSWSGVPVTCHAVDCGRLPSLTRGTSIGQLTTYPNKITFTCDRGYRLTGSRVRECQANRTWSGTMPTCKAVDCGFLAAPRNGSRRGSLTHFPNRVIFYCDRGFKLIGSKIRTCLENGSWSGKNTFCKAVDCGPLAVPVNGSSVGKLTVYPNEIKFSCDEGFILRGSSVRKCMHYKMWSGYTAFCEAFDCGPLDVPVNGTLRGNITFFPKKIRFSCRPGFNLIGSSVRKCLSNGTWSGTKTFCRAKDCGPLVAPRNGSVVGKKTVFPNIIRFYCDDGFDLIGSSKRKCLSNAKWSGVRPKCKAVDCGILPVPMNGSMYGNKTLFPNSVRFSCDEGFNLIGPSVRTCQSNRKWSGTQTSCKAVDCGPLGVPLNGSRHGSSTVFPNAIAFSCDEGFLLRGSLSRVCQANRTWSGALTRCEAIDCGPFPVPLNGSISAKKTIFPITIKLNCNEGFDLIGSAVRSCLSTGKWSGNKTICEAVDCGPLTVPRNGSLQGSSTVFPNVISFSCDEGFLLRGSSSRVCQANRTWSGTLTRCEAVDCGVLAAPVNGSMYGSLTVFPNSIKFSCDEGFDLIGSPERTCLSNGKWDGVHLTCKAVDCGPLAVPRNGSRHGSSTVFPNVITFSCDEGFLLRGSSSRVCQANRTWSGRLTRCEAINCGPLEIPLNGSMTGTFTAFPNIVKFSCDQGFDITGSSVRKCLSNGSWDGTSSECKAVDCGPLAVPRNGSIQGSLTIFPNVMRFNCDKGFLLRGSPLRTCLANRTWSGTTTRCEAIDCGRLDAPMNGSIHGRKTVYPNSVEFKCDEGFDLLGSSVRMCLSNGTWNGKQTICKAVDCGPLTVPQNGSKHGKSTVFPNTITFSCDEGFLLRGSSSRVCQADRTWSGTLTRCEAVDCGVLAVPQNGSLQGSLTVFPNTITFSCDEGFLLRGSSSRVCQANRIWSGSLTRCEAINCGKLAAPINGSMYGNKTVFPNSIEFRCDEGFNLIGSWLRSCLSNGKWSGNKTTCQAVDCGPLAVPRNGSRQGSSTVFPNAITFSCDEGFLLRGSSSRVCQASGTWSGTLTRCKAVDCGPLAVPQNGSLQGLSTVFPSVIIFSCDEGFFLRGSSSRVCQANRTWSGVSTRCEAVDCGALAVPMNGSMYGKSTVFPNSITFKCDEGFDLMGSSVRSCLSSGKWDGIKTTCRAVDCGPLAVPLNGSLQGSSTVFHNAITFSCDEGFLLRGSSSRVCQASGTWSGTLTRCKAVDCGPLAVPQNGSLQGLSTVFPSVIIFSCDEGFFLRGSSSRVCQANRTWSGVSTRCEAVDCGALAVPMNGSMYGKSTVFPNSITFKCDEGFDLIGSSIRSCLSSGKWDGIKTTCRAVDCGPLAVPLNGSRNGSSKVFHNVITFSCDEGFLLRGSSSRVCQANRTWSGSLTRCEAIDCGPLASPINGSVFGSKTVFPNTLSFTCDEGFDLNGSSRRTCLSNGSWSGDQTTCKAVDCGALDVPRHGSRHGSLTFFPNMVKFACDEGFLLRGSPSRVCQANRTWSGSLTRCEAIDCGFLAAPVNGSIFGTKTVFPNSRTFECDEGFNLIGPTLRTCLSNGSWSGTQPKCKAVDCGPLAVPRNGFRHGSSTVFPNVITFSCDEGFLMRGSSSRVCQANRTWDGTLTRCEAVDCGSLVAPLNGSLYGNKTFFPNKLSFKCDAGFDLLGSTVRTCLSSGKWSGNVTSCKAVDCGPLTVPRNGSLQGSSTVFPNVITFSCDEGFLLRGSSSRVCQANRIWSGVSTRCEAVDCGPLAVPMNGSMYGKSTVFLNSITFKCNEGFDLIGSSVRTCLSSGKWDGITTTCRAVDCGPLEVPRNGSLQGSSTVFPNVITFSCDEGFLLRGSSSRVCQANRTWSGRLTRCEAVDCGPLAVPMNGSMYGKSTVFLNTITFKCDEGFDLIGSSVRSCLSSGKWDGITTLCRAVDCGHLAVPLNGSRNGSSTVFPNVITFSCDEGFLLRGSLSRICQANRTWSGTLTRCEAVDCGALAVPMNGSMYGKSTVFPNSITFKCDEGFDLMGSSVRSCLSSGKWDGIKTTCRAVDCGHLAVPPNGSLQGPSTVFPNVISFSCDEGFLLRGSSSRVCLSNRTWSGSVTKCEAVDCGGLAVPRNGSLQGSSTVFPNVITFSCDEGFLLRGSSSRACQANKTWSGTLTRCEAIDCGSLVVPMNGSMYGKKTFYPNILKFSCDEGFDIIGSTERKCLSNGKWSGSVTTCQAVDCGRLPVPLNGSSLGSSTVFPNKISFQCDGGFLLGGSSVRVCQSNRTWSGEEAKCQAIDCGPLAVPMNGSLHGKLTVFPNKIRFNCDEGFDLLGSPIRTCQSNGTWSGSRVSCRAVDCGSLAVPMNGLSSGTLTTYPNRISFACDEGFILIGSAVRTCLSNRMWSGTTTRCQAVDCGPLIVPMNGSSKGSLTVFPNIITFSCDKGFILKGASVRRCQANGSWSGAKTICEVINCGSLLEPRNGFTCGETTVFPHSVKFHCDMGFYLVGSPVRRCQANGVWSGTTTYCRAIDCGRLETPMNGTKKGNVTLFPNIVQFACDEGFILQGSSNRICQANGTWSGIPVRCNAVDCGFLAVPLNGSLQGKLTVFPNKIKFSCDLGFDLIGSSVRRCKSNGLWSGTVTKCQAVDCGPLNVPKHGKLAVRSTTYTQRAVFTCTDGYILKGNSVRVCQANRKWSGIRSKCDAVDCGKLKPPANGAMRGDLTVFPNNVTFSCNDGFNLIGSSVLQCLASGRWSHNTPTCKAMRCNQPVVPPNSYLTTRPQPTFDNNEVMYFSCKPGFFLRGTPLMICRNGNWTKTEFLCLPPKCSPPHVPVNAYITFPRGKKGPYVENDEIYFSCNTGYYLTGKPSITCKKDWTPYKFSCRPVECGPLSPPRRGSIVRSTGTTFGHLYEFGCDWENGFKLEGSQTRKCQASKQWNGTQPWCYLLSCGKPRTPEHGISLDFNYTYNNVVRFRCDQGYSPRGFRETRCQLSSRWTGTGLICLPCTAALGLANKKIPIKMLSASSERDPNHSANQGRLFDNSAWCSARSVFEKYLQVDFESTVEVTAIATQGHPKEYKWVHKYHLKYSLGAHWFEYRVNGGLKVFRGNKDRNTVVKRHLEKPVILQKLRLYRHENAGFFSGSSVCLRMEVYGCQFYTTCLTIGTKVLARWYQWRKQTTYIMGYVREINENSIGIIPEEDHSSLAPGTVLMISRNQPYYVLEDAEPKEQEVIRRAPAVILLRGQDGAAVYPSGKIMNKVGIWYQVSLDNDETAYWRRLPEIRLMKMPESCEERSNDNKLEIKRLR